MISNSQSIHGFGQSSKYCSALPPNWSEYTRVYGYILNKINGDISYKVVMMHQVIVLHNVTDLVVH